MDYRIEKDTLGEIKVDNDKLWGSQTQRSIENFDIGNEIMPAEIIMSLTIIKKAAAITNNKINKLEKNKKELITAACDEILNGKHNEQFPLAVWQTGSGTQTNMNVNEVISNIAIKKSGGKLGSKDPIHPNDDVNKSQSSNDVFPAAMHISIINLTNEKLIPQIENMINNLENKENEFKDIVKCGRTHLQDAVPVTLGQEFSGYKAQLVSNLQIITESLKKLYKLPLGGTAVGTGINAPEDFDKIICEEIKQITGYDFKKAENKFSLIAAHDLCVNFSGSLNTLACSLMKIANDIRWLASGPRCGIGELILPSNEPGSSIMPGKVNPTQCEAITMVCAEIMGNHTAVTIAGSSGNFELNVFKPVIIYNIIKSIHLLADSIKSFTEKCLTGIKANVEKINEYLDNSLMLVTALNPHIGYENSAKIAKLAHEENITLKEAALKLNLLSEDEYMKLIDPKKMI